MEKNKEIVACKDGVLREIIDSGTTHYQVNEIKISIEYALIPVKKFKDIKTFFALNETSVKLIEDLKELLRSVNTLAAVYREEKT